MRVAVVGATGVVGETILQVLAERRVPATQVAALGSRDRASAARYNGRALDVRVTTAESLAEADVVFFASNEDASEKFAGQIAERGGIVIDNSAAFRMIDGVPLIVPEINAHALQAGQRIFPVANCTAIVISMALAPIRDAAGLRSVHAATYQATSGAGRAGLDEWLTAESALVRGENEPVPQAFAAQIARNVVPQIGSFDGAGFSGEERKIASETRKILDAPDLHVMATSVRVPVRSAHAAALFVQTERPTTVADLQRAFARAKGVVFHPHGIVTPRDVEGTDDIHVARLRADDSDMTRFAVWVVGDQLRKGAATNGVQILELLLAKGFLAS